MCRYPYDGRVRVPMALPCQHRICWVCSSSLHSEGAPLRCIQCEEQSLSAARQPEPHPPQNPFVLPVPNFPARTLPSPVINPLPAVGGNKREVDVVFTTPEGITRKHPFRMDDYMWVMIPVILDFLPNRTSPFDLSSPVSAYSPTYLANTQFKDLVPIPSPLYISITYIHESPSTQFTIQMPPGEASLVTTLLSTDSMVSLLEHIARQLRRQNSPFVLMRDNGEMVDEVRLFGITVRDFDTRRQVNLKVTYE